MSCAMRQFGVFIAITGSVVCATVAAEDIYKWQDLTGTTHYSEMPPPVELSSFEVLEVERAGPASPVAEDYRSALELANSLQAGRLEREKLRLERDKLAQEERRARLETERYYDTNQTRYYYGGYYPYRTYSHRPYYGKPHPRPPKAHAPGRSYPGVSVPKRVYPGR